MTDFHQALLAFWQGFSDGDKSIPAHLSGHVPPNTPFPYITFEVVEGAPFGRTVLTAYGWFKAVSGYNVNSHAAAFADEVKAAIPPQGKRIKAGSGMVMLFPNDAGFISYQTDQTDKDVVGARISYEIHYYE